MEEYPHSTEFDMIMEEHLRSYQILWKNIPIPLNVFRAADDNLTVQALSALDDKFIHCNFPFCGRGISSAVKGTLPAATQRRNALHEIGSFVMPAGP